MIYEIHLCIAVVEKLCDIAGLPCSHGCVNTSHTDVQCFCPHGFQLASDGHSCQGEASHIVSLSILCAVPGVEEEE